VTNLTAIEAMLAKCTPGEWELDEMGYRVLADVPGFLKTKEYPQFVVAQCSTFCTAELDVQRANARLFTFAPSLLRELIERVRAMEKALKEINGLASAHCLNPKLTEEFLVDAIDISGKALAEYRALTDERKERNK
jgi:hypothetical protein